MISLSRPQTAFCESKFPFVNERSATLTLGLLRLARHSDVTSTFAVRAHALDAVCCCQVH